MSSRKTPKPNSLNGKRLKRVTQRKAYFAQTGLTTELIQRFDALLEKAGVRVAPEDWVVAIDSALQNYPIGTPRPVALAAIATSYAATLNSVNHAASKSFRNLATALSGDPLHAWWVVFGMGGERAMPLGDGTTLDVIDEACRTVADNPAWGVLGAARGIYLVASGQVTQTLDERVLRDIVGGDDDAARDVLGGEVRRFAVALATDLGIPWKEGSGGELAAGNDDVEAQYGALVEEAKGSGAWPWDEVLARHLEPTGPMGAANAAKIREAGRERMAEALAGTGKVGNHAGHGSMLRLWNDPSFETLGLRWLSQATKSLWYDKVKPERDRAMEAERALAEKRERKPAGVVRAVAADLSAVMSKQLVFAEADDGVIRDHAGKAIGSIAVTDGLSLEHIRKSIEAFGTVTGQRALRGLIHQSHTAWLEGDQNPGVVTYEGGWEAMCEAIGVSSSGANIKLLHHMADAGQAFRWSSEHYKGAGLWSWASMRGGGRHRGHVRFILGDPLTPGLAAAMRGNSPAARAARRLVPELRLEPPMGGARGNEQGAVWLMHRLLVGELVDHSVDLHTNGAVVIPEAKWRAMAATAGLPPGRIAVTLDAWAAGESDKAPALITRAGRDGFTLADPHAPERDFIAEGGARVVKAREAGARGVRTRRAKAKA